MPSHRSSEPSRPMYLAAAAVLVTLVAGAIAVVSGQVKLPALPPVDPATPTGQASPARASSPDRPIGVVAYAVANRIWVVNADGTDARELLPSNPRPSMPDWQSAADSHDPIAWSPDGTRLYFTFARSESAGPGDKLGARHTGLAVTDAVGSAPNELLDFADDRSSDAWCPASVEFDNCQANVEELAVSPDGTRLAYVILEGRDLEVSTVVVLDVATRQITRLDSTRTHNPGSGPNETLIEQPCTSAASQGYDELPRWSPDGTRVVFGRQSIGPRVKGSCQSTILTVDVDDGDLRRLVLPDVPALVPRWSPDGSTIIFHTATTVMTSDIYAVRPDGTGLLALTSDGASVWPHWTRDGRIVFVRWTAPTAGLGELWKMDAEGGNATPVEATIPALTAAGCLVCPYPNDRGEFWAENALNTRLWQPVPPTQP